MVGDTKDDDGEESEKKAEASPEVLGVKSDAKRFKFSPGMVIYKDKLSCWC